MAGNRDNKLIIMEGSRVELGFPGGSVIRIHLLMQETQGMQVQSLGQEDPLEEELATPLQYSCLENSMDRGSWWVIVHGVTKSQTQPNTA